MYRRWLWPGFALPGVVWLIVLFVVPFYTVVAVALGTVDPILFQPVPIWNPLEWNVGWLNEVVHRLGPGGNLTEWRCGRSSTSPSRSASAS